MWHEATVHTVRALRISDLANECWWDVGGKSRACCHAVIPYINTKAYQETGAVEFSLKFSSQVVNQWPACQLWSCISRQGGQGKSACISRHDVDFSCLQSVSATPRTPPLLIQRTNCISPKLEIVFVFARSPFLWHTPTWTDHFLNNWQLKKKQYMSNCPSSNVRDSSTFHYW